MATKTLVTNRKKTAALTDHIPCPTVYDEVTTRVAGMSPDDPSMVRYNVPCRGTLRACPVCNAVRFCGYEGQCLDQDAVTHVIRRRFMIDGIDYGFPGGVQGWTRGGRWNGWACPRFEREAALGILAAQEVLGGRGEYDEASDTMLVWMDLDDPASEPDRYPGETLETPEGTKTVYALGAWAWVWETVEDKMYTITIFADAGASIERLAVQASSIGEALAMMERADAGVRTVTYGIQPADYTEARAEGLAFNEADGLLV